MTSSNQYYLIVNMILASKNNGEWVEGRIEFFRRKCRETGLKITPQRVAIYSELIQTKEHPTADTVYKAVRANFPNISFDTVNRTLGTLVEIGAAKIVDCSQQVRRFDGGVAEHLHFRCIKCKRIIDIEAQEFENNALPRKIEGAAKVLRKVVYFEGLCEWCGKEKR